MPRRSSRRYRRRYPPQRTSTSDRLGLGRAGQRPRFVRWGLAASVVVLALGLIDTRTGLLREGRPIGAALLVDALLIIVGVIVYLTVLKRGLRARDRDGRSFRRR